MTPERWKRIEELYHAAHARSPDQRAAFLADACRDDEVLRREVEALLKGTHSDDGFLAEPPLVLPAHMVSELAPADMTGASLGGYQIQMLLGAGGMGEVYRARDTKLGRDVAIKILPRTFTSNPDRLARFEREARMLAALNHPNICAIYGIEQSDDLRFLILELVTGETLEHMLAEISRVRTGSSGLPLRDALTIAHQIVEALEAAHEKGIIHRDLKPANISITADGVVKVLDFGLAKTVGGDGSAAGLTQAPAVAEGGKREGAVIGTAAYMSPEQARGLPVDKRTDIWAFGCVLYEMLTGRVTFAGKTVSDSIAKILERDPDWSALPPTTPPAIRRLLLRCLTKDPKQRLRDIGDARIEINAIDEVLPGAAENTALAARPERRWLPWMALLTLAAAWGVREAGRPAVPDDPMAGAQFIPLTKWEGSEEGAEISPDARFVTFLSDRAGEFDQWGIQVGTEEFDNLTENEPKLHAPGILRTSGFSGDGSEIWFGAVGKPIMRMPQSGGAPRRFLMEDARAPAWSARWRTGLSISTWTSPIFGTLPMRYLADLCISRTPRALTPNRSRSGHLTRGTGQASPTAVAHTHNPVWSPDGQWIYFTHGVVREWNSQGDEMDIWRVSPSGGSPERMTRLNTDITFLAPISARTLLYTARAEDGSGPWLWSLDIPSRVSRRIISGTERYTSVSASRDGGRIVVTEANPSSSLWTVPILDRPADDADVEPFPVQTDSAVAPRYGGDSLFYLAAGGTGDGLWAFTEGKPFKILKGADGPVFEFPAPSPDGSRVAVIRRREGKQLLTIMLANGTEERTLAPSLDVSGAADWSPDGKWIAAGGIDAAGRRGLFMIAVDGERAGEPIRLADGEASNPVWSPPGTPDGPMIIYSGPFARGQVPLLAVRPDRSRVELSSVRVSPGVYRFLRDGTGIVYLPRPESLDFSLLDLVTGTVANSHVSLIKVASRGSTSRQTESASSSTVRGRTAISS